MPQARRVGGILSIVLLLTSAPAWGALAMDVTVWTNRSASGTTITSPPLSTASDSELLLAFVATDGTSAGMTVTSVTGGSLTWELVRRTNAQLGTAEVWRAFAPTKLTNVTVSANLSQRVAASMTVISFTGIDTSGTNGSGAIGAIGAGAASSGAPAASLVTTRNNSWVFGVGVDWDSAIGRTVPSDQILVNQYLATVGDTYWVQRQNAPTAAKGTTVTINATAPTSDRYNLAIVEVLPTPPANTFTVAGTISPAQGGNGAVVRLGTSPIRTTTVDTFGRYSFTGVDNGVYPVTPTKSGFMFTPASRSVTVNGGDVPGVNFTAALQAQTLNYPDLSVIMPTAQGQMSIVGSGSARMLQYTHETFNGGSGPLVIQPTYNPAAGSYQGVQYVYAFSEGTWTLEQQIPIAGAFVFHPAHGHFHFPLATYGLFSVAPNGGVGDLVVMSQKIGFCINDSFIWDPTLPNAGALGNLGPCTDPTTLRGLDIGAVDEYDQTDPDQNISLANVPDGTYWLRVVVDPNNFLAESDKSNNETDVLLTISGNTVAAHQVMSPILAPPPGIMLATPSDGSAASGVVSLTANPTAGTPVQFLIDGQALGGSVPSPYTLAWDTRMVPDGSHWVAVQTTDPATGITGTSAVARVTVSNAGTHAPVVTITSPEAGTTVSASITVAATVAGGAPITGVQLYVDDVPLGAPLTSPPFLMLWDTRTSSDGPHTVTASATDSFALTGTSAPVAVTVDNSHPPLTITIDALAFADSSDTMTTTAFSTTTDAALLVAFVGYDGPTGTQQTAVVTGAGLTWTLMQRSNVQFGTAEIWAAKATGVLTNATVTSQPGVRGFHGSLVVVAFANAAGVGIVGQTSAPSGAPDIFLPGVAAGNWVFAVGNDWDRAVPRTPMTGQYLVHQRVDTTVGDTFWVQATTASSTASGIVTIHDTAPTTDQWNYAAAEIVAARQ
jgi:Bacterial Ig domain/Lysyl oxidase